MIEEECPTCGYISTPPTNEVTVAMPLHLTSELIRAVRNHPLTAIEDKDEMHTRIGWLICAYDAMIEYRTGGIGL